MLGKQGYGAYWRGFWQIPSGLNESTDHPSIKFNWEFPEISGS